MYKHVPEQLTVHVTDLRVLHHVGLSQKRLREVILTFYSDNASVIFVFLSLTKLKHKSF